MNDKIQVNAIYNEEISPDAPYGVEVLIGTSETDPTQGSSEMSWYKTETEQMTYYHKVLFELTSNDMPKPADTIESLTAEYQSWCSKNGYPQMSADELLAEMTMIERTSDAQESYEDYLVRGENRQWLNDFVNRWEKAENDKPYIPVVKNNKFYKAEETGTVYFIEVQGDKEYLAGMPMSSDGTFQLDESFIVEEFDESIGSERVNPTFSKTVAEVWAEARKALA